MLLVCQNGSINIALFVCVELAAFNLSITLHFPLSVNALYPTSYTHNYLIPCSTLTYCVLSTHIIHLTLQHKNVFLNVLCQICAFAHNFYVMQMYSSIVTLIAEVGRMIDRNVYQLYNVYKIISHTYAHYLVLTTKSNYRVLGCDVVYNC